MSSEDSGVDAGSNESNESVCMSFASSVSDYEPEVDNNANNENIVHNINVNINRVSDEDSALNPIPMRNDNNGDHLLANSLNFQNFLSNPLGTRMHDSSYLPSSSQSSLVSTSTSLTIPSIASHSRHDSLPSSSSAERPMSQLFESHFDHNLFHVEKIDSLKYGNNDCECDTIAVPNDCYYNNNKQHDYCPKMKTSRQRKHELICKNISKDIAGERMLRRASNSDDIETVERLLKNGINPQACDERSRTPLHFAASKGNTRITRLLLENGADPNLKDAVGNTPLHLAACTNHIEVITLLLTAGTDINSSDNWGRTPLHLAESKLKMLQTMQTTNMSMNSNQIKNEVLQVVEMMSVYLQRSGKNAEVELLSAFTNRLHLHQTKEEVDIDVKDLLTSLSHLSL